MADLFWPGDERAALAFDPGSFLETLVEVEDVWLHVLVEAGVAPAAARADLARPGHAVPTSSRSPRRAEASGNPVVPLLSLLRERLEPTTGRPPPGCTAG